LSTSPAEERIRQSEERLKKAQAIAHVGNWEIDLRTRTVWASDEAFRIYGVERVSEEIPLDVVQAAVRPEYRPALDRALRRLLDNEGVYDEEFEITQWSTGNVVYLHSKAEVVRTPDGIPVKVIGVVQDITARKRAELALTARTEQLDAVRNVSAEITRELDLTRLLALIVKRAMALVRAERCTIRFWNERAQVLDGTVTCGLPLADAGPLRLDEGVIGVAAGRREGLIVNDYPSFASAILEPESPAPPCAVMGAPLLYRDRLVGVIAASHHTPGRTFAEADLSTLQLFADQAAIALENARLFAELNASYASLREAQDELVRAEKLRALGQMAAGIAHDLNNVLAAILGQVELLKLQRPAPEVREGLDTLETAATDGAHVVRRLQDFARQRATSPLGPMDLRQAVQDALAITRPRWQDEVQRRGATISIHVALDGLPHILGHAPEVREALINVILNAVDAMAEGGKLTFAGAATPSGVTLGVTDTGIGMSEAVRQKIFEPFFTTKGLHGTGLGLSVVYGILERHGGRVEVESSPGQGTTITLHFQAATETVPASEEATPLRPIPQRLLLIDDEPLVRTTTGNLLRVAGHTVLEAESGAAGLALLAEHPVDCVLTDLGMPAMTGWEVAQAVKAEHPMVPVILLTGWGEQAAGETGRAEVSRVLGKPIRLEELLRTIAALTSDPATEG